MFMFQMATVTNLLMAVLSVCCATVLCHDPVEDKLQQLQLQVGKLDLQNQNITDVLGRLYIKVEQLESALTSRLG